VSSESEVSRKKSGSEFQTIRPATENARRPKLERRWRGTMSCTLYCWTGNERSNRPIILFAIYSRRISSGTIKPRRHKGLTHIWYVQTKNIWNIVNLAVCYFMFCLVYIIVFLFVLPFGVIINNNNNNNINQDVCFMLGTLRRDNLRKLVGSGSLTCHKLATYIWLLHKYNHH